MISSVSQQHSRTATTTTAAESEYSLLSAMLQWLWLLLYQTGSCYSETASDRNKIKLWLRHLWTPTISTISSSTFLNLMFIINAMITKVLSQSLLCDKNPNLVCTDHCVTVGEERLKSECGVDAADVMLWCTSDDNCLQIVTTVTRFSANIAKLRRIFKYSR